MPDKPELTVLLSDQVKEAMAEDADVAKMMKDMIAVFHQAQHAVDTGQHETFEDAVEAITGNRPEPIDLSELDD